MSDTSYILNIPEIALEKVFSFLTYDEIAKNRIVCKKFNGIGGRLLSRGFIQMEKRHNTIYKRVKGLLPRRESERRVHPLSRHCDILQAVETRISMLNMTYMRYIESNLLCFIPGKVLDEMINVLNLVESDYTPPRTHQLLQELRDLSSMAMEHFDEHILPGVKEQMDDQRQTFLASYTTPNTLKQPKLVLVQQGVVTELQKIKRQYRKYKHTVARLVNITHKLFEKVKFQHNQLNVQSVKIRDQERKVQEQSNKIQEQEATLADIKKHMDEWDQKYTDLSTELIRTRDEILVKPVNPPNPAPTNADSCSPSPPKFFKTTIKPRMAQILPKSCGRLKLDLERKRKSNLLPEIPVKLSRSCLNSSKGDAGDLQLNDNEQLKSMTEKYTKNFAHSSNSSDSTGGNSELSSIIETIIKTPLTGIKSRKRKIMHDIDLK